MVGSHTEPRNLKLSPLTQVEPLLGYIESIGGETDLQPLLTRILRAACDLIGADHGMIGLVDEGENVVRTEAIYNLPADELGSVMAPGVGLAGKVLLTRQPVVLRRYGDIEEPVRSDTLENPVIGMPIEWQGRMIGFFGIGVDAEAARRAGRVVHHLTSKDLTLLSTFARHAAIAIQNARRHEQEQQRSNRLMLIARIGHIIAANLDLDELLNRTADAIHELLSYQNVAIPLLEPDDPDTLVLNTVGGHYKKFVKGEYRIPVSEGIMGAAVRSGAVQMVNDVTADPRHIPTPGAVGIIAELAVPIRLGGRVLGVLNVESSVPFNDEDAASLQIVADHLAIAVENARLYERAQQLAAFEERQRLARELHDAVTQHIFGMNLIAQSLAAAWRRDPAEAEKRVERLVELGGTALAEMRALLAELRPVDASAVVDAEPAATSTALVRQKGLVEALRRHVTQLAADGPSIELDAKTYRPQPVPAEEALFRIAQEALNNVIKHAHARRVVVQLNGNDSEIRLAVRDDGVGFDPPSVESARVAHHRLHGGFGLSTMRERASALGGAFEASSAPGHGTLVEARIPLPDETRS